MTAPDIVRIPDDDRNLDEFNSEQSSSAAGDASLMVVMEPAAPEHTPAVPAPFSRVDAAAAFHARKALQRRTRTRVRRAVALAGSAIAQPLARGRVSISHTGMRIAQGATTVAGYGLALIAFAALRCDSLASAASRIAHPASMSSRRALRDWMPARRIQPDAFSALESEGAMVAAALGTVAIAYGGLLLMSWGASATPVSASAVAVRHASVEPVVTAAPPAIPAVAVALPDRVAGTRPRGATINAATVDAIWRRSDTRSLQDAFARVRRETRALHHCSMQMTTADRAVARCDGDGRRWTFDFQRTGNRWVIERVSPP